MDRKCCHRRQAGIRGLDVREAMLERLRAVRHATNELRARQRYSVLVLRLDRGTYPSRYVELF